MFSSLLLTIFFLINLNKILSVQLGKIERSSIKSSFPIYPSSHINCTDCLCDCFNPSLSCLGINCFPLNHTCQLIEQQPWIFESDLLINMTSNNFIEIKANQSRFCSCYTPQKLLNFYGQINLTDYPTTTNIRSIKYIPNDDTLIVLNATIIRKLSAKNLSNILRSLTVSSSSNGGIAVSILHNDTKIYIAFALNRSINMFDLNLTLLQTSISWSNQAGYFAGICLFNNQILIMDVTYSIIWLVNTLNQSNLIQFFDFSSYNISNPTSLFVYQNQSLYISSTSTHLHLFNLNHFTLQQIISVPSDVTLLFMRYDSNCNRLWFGTQNYTYAPVLDLASNQMNTYITEGMISKYGIYSIDFDLNYAAFFANTNENLHQIYLPDINC